MSGRQIFSESEKWCLQELIIKHKLNTTSTIPAGNPAAKKMAWARLVEEYNSIESNSKRTESQLKKCWDNLKTRKKALLAEEKRDRMRTGGGQYCPKPGSSKEDPMLLDEALVEQTDVELQYVIDSDNLPVDVSQEIPSQSSGQNLLTQTQCEPGPLSPSHIVTETEPESERENRGRSGSRLTDYSTGGQQTPGTAKNIRSKVIHEEFILRKHNYIRLQEREEELHRLMVEEKQWLVKTAQEKFKTAEIEHRSAEEVLRLNVIKREEAEKTNKL